MSAKGRTSVILLASLVACLLIIPPTYLAIGARLDKNALDRRIAILAASAVENPTALQARYRLARERILPILPPDPDCRLTPSGGIIVFDPVNFSWAAALEPAELNGVMVFPVTLAEDPETRYTIFYNGSAEPIGSLASEQDYFPYAWLADRHPEYYAENADPDMLAWAEAIYDPARVSVTYYLLASDDVEAMAEAQLAAVQPEFEMDMMMGEGLPEPVTNIVIFAIEKTTNGMALGIGWPNDFTNNLEVFARATIASTGWFVVSSSLSTAGTNSLWWTDTSVATSDVTRFYSVGNADLDSDDDGVADARERKVTGTDEDVVDTDGDGLSDGDEIEIGTDPLDPDPDNDGLTDAEEVFGISGFRASVTITNGSWIDPEMGAAFITQWTGVAGGRVDAGYSPPISFPIILGAYTGSTVRVASDGYLVIDAGYPSNTPSADINLPESNLCVAAFWDDLTISASTGVWFQASGTGQTAQLTISWSGAETKMNGQGLDFQCTYSASNRSFVFNYRNRAGKIFPSTGFYTVGLWGNGLMPKSSIAFNQLGLTINAGMSIAFSPAITDPFTLDTDGDGATDGQEALWGFNAASSNAPTEDWDKDGLFFSEELARGTNPTWPDSDSDGLVDGADSNPEIATDPTVDTDDDGLVDWLEAAYGTCVTNVDTDADGKWDGAEAGQGSNPADGSDEGLAPESTVDVTVNLETYGRGNVTGAGGTAIWLGSICHRIPPPSSQQSMAATQRAAFDIFPEDVMFSGLETWSETQHTMTYRLARGKAYELTIGPVLGNIEDKGTYASMLIEDYESTGWDENALNLGTCVIDFPEEVLRWWDVVLLPTNHAVVNAPAIHIKINGTNITEYIGAKDEQAILSAVVSPAINGAITWSCDNPEMLSATTGDTVTVTMKSEASVSAEFLSPGAVTGVSASVSFQIRDHVHHWGTMAMSLPPFIRLNDNDSNHNSITDRCESLSSSNDINIVRVQFSFQEEPDILACCLTNYPKPWAISLVNDSGADKVRNINGVTPGVIVSNAVLSSSSSNWIFEVEGTNLSYSINDVGYQGMITFSNNESECRPFATTIGKSTLEFDVHPMSQCLLLNEDDDNANGTNDNLEVGDYPDDELLEIPSQFLMEPDCITNGTLTLYVTEGGSRVRLWADRSKSTAIQANQPRPPGEWGTNVFVEGIQKSENSRDIGLICAYENGIFDTQKCVRLTVVKADLDMQGVAEGREDVSWANNYIFYNHDDDNSNCVIDVNDSGAVANENDLRKITLSAGPSTLVEGDYELDTLYSSLRVWEGSNKTGLVTLPARWSATGWANKVFWVEGLYPSMNDDTLTFRYTNSISLLADQVKVFDLYVDLSLGAIQDGEEEMVGGFVGLNKDDDNANGVADYLDNGAPWLEDDDLIELRLGLSLYLTNGIFKLEVLEGAEHIRLWEKTNWIIDPPKEVRMPLTNVWDLALGDPAEYASIEGISTSSIHRDVVLRLSYSNESFYAEDVVKFSVVNVELIPQSTNVCWKMTNQVEILTTNMFSPNGILWTGTNGLAVVSTDNEKLVFTPTNSIPTNYLIKAEVVGLSSCYDTATVTVYRVDLDPSSTNVCGNTTNRIEIVVTNGYAPNGIVWSGTNGLAVVSENSTNLVFTPTNSVVTNYSVRAAAVGFTNCSDVCEVTVLKVEIEKCASGFLPQGGTNDNTTTIRAFVTPNTVKGRFTFTLENVSDEAGYCVNAPITVPGSGEDSDSWKDLQFPTQTVFTISGSGNSVAETTAADVNEATVTVKSFDYGAYGKIKVAFTPQGSRFICLGREQGGTDEFTRIPRDADPNNIADCWSHNVGGSIDDADASLNNTMNGDGLTRYQEYRGVDINADGVIAADERLNPAKKDIFARGSGYSSNDSFSYGSAFAEAQIVVHEVSSSFCDRETDVMVVTHDPGAYSGTDGHINKTGVRTWTWDTKGASTVGSGTIFGDPKTYKLCSDYYFSDSPYDDNNANGELDYISVAGVEDVNDNGVLDSNENDGSGGSTPTDDGDGLLDGDHVVTSGSSFDWAQELADDDIDDDGMVELPRYNSKPVNSADEYSKAQVLQHTITHEMGHAAGVSGHCSEPACLMYNSSNNWKRDGHFCDACRSALKIHNN